MDPSPHLFDRGAGGACVFIPSGEEDLATAAAIFHEVSESTERPFRLVFFPVQDWNRDLSPWKAEAIFQDRPFAGGADQTLRTLLESLVPDLGGDRPLLLGYSLSGLFCLWALTKTEVFFGAGSCSGSLWFPDFPAYLTIHPPRHGAHIYLSLGDREEKTHNPHLRSIGDNTRSIHAALSKREDYTVSPLVMNRGNHFQGVPHRMALGILWLLNSFP